MKMQYRSNCHSGNVIALCNAQLANRINLHLALGGSFDSTPP
jgi:hypothetical protein